MKIGEVKEETEKRQADTKDFTSSSKFSGSCVLTLQTLLDEIQFSVDQLFNLK